MTERIITIQEYRERINEAIDSGIEDEDTMRELINTIEAEERGVKQVRFTFQDSGVVRYWVEE